MDEDKKLRLRFERPNKFLRRVIGFAASALFFIPLMWYTVIKITHVQFTYKQIIANMLMGYAVFGVQIYGAFILIELYKNYRDRDWFSDENLKLYQRLGIVITAYVFIKYFVRKISLVVNEGFFSSKDPAVLFSQTNLYLLLAGILLFLSPIVYPRLNKSQ